MKLEINICYLQCSAAPAHKYGTPYQYIESAEYSIITMNIRLLFVDYSEYKTKYD